jgi:hypothetical protein
LSAGNDGLSSPCFHFTPQLAVLPAFGTFTGSHSIRPAREDRVFVIGPDEVIDVSATLAAPNPQPKTRSRRKNRRPKS